MIFDNSPSRMRQMKQDIPEMIEIFEQSKEYLDILRNGNFVSFDRRVEANYGLIIEYGRGGVPYDEWDTIEWLSAEERDAILFLFTSDELNRNFMWIVSDMEEPTLRATLYMRGSGNRTDNIEIWHGEGTYLNSRRVGMQDSYSRDLGDRYTLWVYTERG